METNTDFKLYSNGRSCAAVCSQHGCVPDARSKALSSLSRNIELKHNSAVVVIDMQNAFVHPNSDCRSSVSDKAYVESAVKRATFNIASIICAARRAGIEVMYTVVEALTKDGREISLDYKISGLQVSRNSWGARVIDQLKPNDDDIVLAKGASSVFTSTNITYLLRNLGIQQVLLVGGLTDQCIDSAVRDACDLGFLVSTAVDACYTHSEERHRSALRNNAGYGRQVVTQDVVAELNSLTKGKSRELAVPAHSPRVMPKQNASVPEYIRFEVTDLNGKALSKLVPARHRDSAVYMYSGAVAFGSNSVVMTIPDEIGAAGCPNARLIPDWSTETILPYANVGEARGVVRRVICEQDLPSNVGSGTRYHLPRAAARRVLNKLSSHGLQLLSASEYEFCVADAKEWEPLFNGPEIFVTLHGTKSAPFQLAIEQGMHAVGVDVQTMNAEYGSGQLEIVFAPKFGLAASDAAVTFRTGVKEIAMGRGTVATFFSKPFSLTGVGNGGHFNFSLWENATNARSVMRVDDCEKHGIDALSQVAKHFLAGVLEHAPGMEAFCAPTPGCYSRHGNWAPSVADWGLDDRLAAVRVKVDLDAGATYFEFRSPSSSANPYLVTAAVVAAGIDGIERKLTLPPPRQTADNGAVPLPTSLGEALVMLQNDKTLVNSIGVDIVRWFCGVKNGELTQIDQWIEELVAQGESEEKARLTAWRRMYFEWI